MSLEQSKKIRFVLTRHEQGAAFMAEIYGRLTGNPAGCLGTLGPGATNLITGVADSNMDRAPMLVLTGQGSTDRLHKESHQIMDVRQHVSAGHQVGGNHSQSRHDPGNGAQGGTAGSHRETRRRTPRAARRCSGNGIRPEADSHRAASAAQCPTTRSSIRPTK